MWELIQYAYPGYTLEELEVAVSHYQIDNGPLAAISLAGLAAYL